jgi:hypothetical protein
VPDLDKKLGPLSRKAWIGVAAGTVGVYYLYRRYEASVAARSSSALLGGSTVPTDTGGSVSTTSPSFSTLGAWEAAAIAAMTGPGYNNAQALNDINAWLAGSCVSAAGYTALSSILGNQSIGLPPGYTSLPAIQVCSSSQNPAPPAGGGGPANPGPAAPNALQQLEAEAFPHQYNFGSYTFSPGGPGTQFTQVGTIQNGKYNGAQVLAGAPVYAGVFGALVQNFTPSKLPNGVGVYVPTYLVNEGYVQGLT